MKREQNDQLVTPLKKRFEFIKENQLKKTIVK